MITNLWLGWSIGQTYAPLSTNTRPCFALHRVEYRQTYASLSTKTRPSPFLCIRWSLGRNLCSTLHGNLLVMIPIYLSLQSRLAGNSSATRKALTTRSCEVIVNGSPLTINTNFMTVNLQVITRNKPCTRIFAVSHVVRSKVFIRIQYKTESKVLCCPSVHTIANAATCRSL